MYDVLTDYTRIESEGRTGRSGECEILVDKANGHRSFADGGSHAVYSSGSNIAGGEDAWNTRLKW